jgi:glycosyltransferase involved in cell wall biosynthesis
VTATTGRPRVAYIVSRFPKLTETFILYEMLAMERLGIGVELFPLMRARASGTHPEGQPLWRKILERIRPDERPVEMHPEARAYVERAHYSGFLSRDVVVDNLRAFRRAPRRYLRTIGLLLVEMTGSWNYLVGSLAIFPLAVHFGERMRAMGIDHVHAHFANHPATAAWIVRRIAGLPYSFTAHGADLQVDQHMLGRKVRDAVRTITISDYNRRFIAEHMASENGRVSVVRCGVDTESVLPPSERHRAIGAPIEILCIGTFYEVKGHPHLIEACRLLRERGVPFVCRLIGEGPDEAVLRHRVSEAGLAESVSFEGTRTRSEVVQALHRADVLVVPSIPTQSGRREGIPVVLMEAMATALPVVASNISGIPELVDDGTSGILVPAAEPGAIADAVETLAKDPSMRERMGAAGRARVVGEFDQSANARLLAHQLGLL